MPKPQDQLASVPAVAGEDHRQRALELRLKGLTYRAIARELDLAVSTVHEHVINALEEHRTVTAEKAGQVRELELARLDAMLEKLWEKREDPRTADSILRISQRRADLLGLDAPKNIKIGGDGTPVQQSFGPDLTKLSVEQLLQLETLLAAAAPAPAAIPATSTAPLPEG